MSHRRPPSGCCGSRSRTTGRSIAREARGALAPSSGSMPHATGTRGRAWGWAYRSPARHRPASTGGTLRDWRKRPVGGCGRSRDRAIGGHGHPRDILTALFDAAVGRGDPEAALAFALSRPDEGRTVVIGGRARARRSSAALREALARRVRRRHRHPLRLCRAPRAGKVDERRRTRCRTARRARRRRT